jgi:hypothetical protein
MDASNIRDSGSSSSNSRDSSGSIGTNKSN